MITCLEKEMEEGGQVLTKVLGVIMITTGPDQGTMREEEETTNHSRGQILVLDTVDEIEIIDQHLQGETEALPEEDLEEITREEEITEYIPQTEMINQDPKKDIDPSSLQTIKEGPQVVLEAVTMVEMGRETKEKVVKEGTIIGVSARKEGTTENERMIEEEGEEVKSKKAKRASLDAFVGAKDHLAVKCPIYKERSPTICRDCKLEHPTSKCRTRRQSNHTELKEEAAAEK